MLKLEIDSSTLAELSSLPIEKDFTFKCDKGSFSCNKFFACAFSTKIRKMISLDPTVSSIKICGIRYPSVLEKIVFAFQGKEVNFAQEDVETVYLISKQLQSSSLTEYTVNSLNDGISVDNCFSTLLLCIKMQIDATKTIDFIGKNLLSISFDKTEVIPLDFAKDIVIKAARSNSKEDIIQWIDTYTCKYGDEYAELVQLIDTSSLNEIEIANLASVASNILVRNLIISSSIDKIAKLLSNISLKEKKEETMFFAPSHPGSINGVFSYLKRVTKSNIVRNLTISIFAETNSIYLPDLVELTGEAQKKHYKSDSYEGDKYIIWDLKEMRIQLSAYTIVSCFCAGNGCEPKKWEIQGSNDLSRWALLHSVDNDDSLLGKYSSSTFYVDDVSESYRYIKYIQRENHSTNKIIHLSGFELFGTLSGVIPT